MANKEHKESESSIFISPRFKSLAAMAGWDEEALLSASLIVDDTPDRELSHKKRVVMQQLKTPPSSDSRKRKRVQRSPVPIIALDLAGVDATKNDDKKDEKMEKKETEGDDSSEKDIAVSCSSSSLPCMDKLREELSCAICLDICYEPSSTPCGHSFCLKCLRFATSKCGKKCPKCRQVLSNGRSCTVNTVLWNTIQLLFPQEVEAKKAAGDSKSREAKKCEKVSESAFYDNLRNESPRNSETTTTVTRRRRRSARFQNEDDPIARLVQETRSNVRGASSSRPSSRGLAPTQDEDAAMALRLQREEFMGVVRSSSTTTRLNRSSSNQTSNNQNNSINGLSSSSNSNSSTIRSSSSFSSARENLRAMASRATNHSRGWNF